MKVFQEVTEWSAEFAVPNHIYFLNDSKEKIYGYVNSKGIVQTMSKPYRFYAGGRKFKEIENRWNFKLDEEPEVTPGKQYKVVGSKNAVYTVTDDAGSWSCTCPASKWQKGECKHIKELRNES